MRMSLVRAAIVSVILALPLASAAEDVSGAFHIPGVETDIRFTGFAETTLFYEFSGGAALLSRACDYYLCPTNIALQGQTTYLQTALAAAYSRFGVETTTPSPIGAVGTRFEVDAAGGYQLIGETDTHSAMIRIRHAYGTIGEWFLMGQTWSTFADLNTFPDQMDENPVANLAALRGPMIRFTIPAGLLKVSLALEDPYFTSLVDNTVGPTYPIWNVPDVIARLDLPVGPATLSLRGVAKQYKTESASAMGFGGAAGAAVPLGRDTLVLDVSGGPGIGTYVYGTTLGLPEDAVEETSTRTLKLWTVLGASAGYTHVWSPHVRSNLMASAIWTKDDSGVAAAVNSNAGTTGPLYGSFNRSVYTVGANTYWSPSRTFWVGAEFYYNYRDTFSSVNGQEFRGEFVSHFNFF